MSAAPRLRWVRLSDVGRDLETGRLRPSAWLTEMELERWSGLRVPKRRLDWLAGRIAAKLVVLAEPGLGSLAATDIELLTAPSGVEQGRPSCRSGHAALPLDISLAHSGDLAVAAVTHDADRIGVDVEVETARPQSFEDVMMAPAERELLSALSGRQRTSAVTMIWTLKEALLKAVGIGLRMPLHHLVVTSSGLTLASRLDEFRPPRTASDPASFVAPATNLFSIAAPSRQLHPLLERFDELLLSLFTFRHEGLVGTAISFPSGGR